MTFREIYFYSQLIHFCLPSSTSLPKSLFSFLLQTANKTKNFSKKGSFEKIFKFFYPSRSIGYSALSHEFFFA